MEIFDKILHIIRFIFIPWYRKGNRIFICKKNGKVRSCVSAWGVTVRFKGENNIVKLSEPLMFERRLLVNRTKFRINGDNNYIEIKKSNIISNLKLDRIRDNNVLIIDENFYQTGECVIDFCDLSDKKVLIGKNCMFGINSRLMLGDSHTIYDIKTKECLNKPKRGIVVGNHVWFARDVKILKDSEIANDTVVGMGSIVNKRFQEENVIIAGCPAKVVKRNVNWQKKNTIE